MGDKSKKPSLIRSFMKDRNVASIIPTSKSCVRDICTRIDFNRNFTLVEYGPGSGAFTDYILKRANFHSRIIAIEKNKELSDYLTANNTDKRLNVFNNDAINVEGILKPLEIEKVDYVLSGIPFSLIDEVDTRKIIQNTREILDPNGKFLVYQVRKKGVEEHLRNYFEFVNIRHYHLNIPPLFLFETRRNNRK